MRIFKHLFRKGHRTDAAFRSISEILPVLLNKRQLEHLHASYPDRRNYVEGTASILGMSESEILDRVSAILEIPVLHRVNPVTEWAHLGAPSITECRTAGIIPLSANGVIMGVACVDPAQVSAFFPNARMLQVYIAPWLSISQALDESEKSRAALPDAASDLIRTRGEKLAEEILGYIILEVHKKQRNSVTLSFGSEISYSFMTFEGRNAYGSVDVRMTSVLKKFVRDGARAGMVSIRVPEPEAPQIFRIRMVRSDERFVVEWGACLQIEEPVETSERSGKVVPFPNPSHGVQMPEIEEGSVQSVLIVEDNDTFSHVLERFLRRHGVKTLRSTNGIEALEMLRTADSEVALAVCDVHMPGMDGFEFLKAVRDDTKLGDVPVIMLTSDDDVETEIRVISSGADAFISKSNDPRVLWVHVQRLLDKQRRKAAA